MRQERSVRRNGDDDRPRIASVGRVLGNLSTYRDTGNAQQGARAAIALNKNSHRIAAQLLLDLPRSGSDAPLELVADHSCATAHMALGDGARSSVIDGLEHVVGLHVEAIDV